ncbi:response regulator transcription factor [Methylomonas sp. 11b]|uniref:response regulator transcription factor n=1 Tax=Methylomonas sp. 11b TaxID=1168169 RepID=UPI00047A3A96|nr:LuxR C-terminal-related transcriptional regulator [Methylomonas sp. 11b]
MALQVLELDRLILVADREVSSFKGINRVRESLQTNVDYVASRDELCRWIADNKANLTSKNIAFVMVFDPEVVEISPSGSEFGLLLEYPRICITRSSDLSTTLRSIKTGLFDFIEKPFSLEQIRKCLELAFFEYEFAASINNQFRNLTKREIETCELVVLGHTNKEISEKLDISIKTVKVHRANLMRKTNAKTVTDLLRLHDTFKSNTRQGLTDLPTIPPLKILNTQQTNKREKRQKSLA